MTNIIPSGAIFVLWMLYSLVVGGIITLAAIAAHDAQRATRRPVRWVWLGAIALLVAITAVAPMRRTAVARSSEIRLGIPATAASSARAVHGLAGWIVRAKDAVLVPIQAWVAAAGEIAYTRLAQLPPAAYRVIALAWVAASLLTLLTFLASYRRVRGRMRTWPIQRVNGIEARIAPTTGPAVVGFAPAEIVIPEWLLGRPTHERELVLAHESEHLRAHDPWLLVLGCVAVTVMPWHPAIWYAFGRLRLAIEFDCDRRVLRRGVPAATYGSLLIDLTALHPVRSPAMPAFSFHGSSLEQRLVAMTARPARFTALRRATGGLIAAVALIAACESRLPTSAEVEAMDVATAQQQAAHLTLTESAATRYVVDGKTVTAAEARALPAKRIATIEVSRTSKGDPLTDEVRIVTRTPSDSAKQASEGAPDVLHTNPADVKFRMRASAAGGDSLAGEILDSRPRKAWPGGTVDSLGPEDASSPRRKFGGLLVVDGKIVDSAELERIRPEHIRSVEILKGDAAMRAYSDPRAAEGVIKVTTNKAP